MQREVRWWWVRHAPVINPSGNIYGQLDRKADLSNDAAFAALAQRLPRGAAWCVTPLSRTQDTAARLIAEGTDPLGDPAVEPAFLEQSFGDWQGRPHAEVAPRGHLAWLAPATTRWRGRSPPRETSSAAQCETTTPVAVDDVSRTTWAGPPRIAINAHVPRRPATSPAKRMNRHHDHQISNRPLPPKSNEPNNIHHQTST